MRRQAEGLDDVVANPYSIRDLSPKYYKELSKAD
jgi:hypothetical protein